MGRWKDDVQTWITCPNPDNASSDGIWQTVLSLFKRDVAAETDSDVVCPYAWARPINQLNCDFIVPKALDEPPYNQQSLEFDSRSQWPDSAELLPESEVNLVQSEGRYHAGSTASNDGPYLELDTAEYAGKIRDEFVVEQLLAQGGVRLAGVLNWLFASLEENEEPEGLWVQNI